MAKTIVITQPNYLPWLGYFEQIRRADIFVFLDDVQYIKREWINRNRIKTPRNNLVWLTVPVKHPRRSSKILEIEISDHIDWRKKHINTITSCLGKAPYFGDLFPSLEEVILKRHKYLVDLNIELIKTISNLLNLSPQYFRSSEILYEGKKAGLILDICKKFRANVYYSSMGAKVYLENESSSFRKANIEIVYQDWIHPEYRQLGDKFISHLSIVDTLLNIGIDETKKLIV